MSKAPYDERNAKDFDDMTERIEAALEVIKSNKTIPATEAELCKRAVCSRGTLRNRRWPVERLKEIKKARKKGAESEPDVDSPDNRPVVEILMEENKKLKAQLGKSRTEVAEWVHKYKNKEEENKKLLRLKNVLTISRQNFKEMVGEYERRFGRLETVSNQSRGKKVVVPFPQVSQGEGPAGA